MTDDLTADLVGTGTSHAGTGRDGGMFIQSHRPGLGWMRNRLRVAGGAFASMEKDS
jgi:hypothetical protein